MLKIALFCLLYAENIQLSLADENTSAENVNSTTNNNNFYKAAVVELNPPGDSYPNALQKVQANLEEFIKLINVAKENDVDIMAFPEGALNYYGTSREDLKSIAISLPEEMADTEYEYNCDYSSNAILNELSDAVANASMYVLVNMIEIEECSNESTTSTNKFFLYNTNIVFNRYGCIISKYRKINLFIEPLLNAGMNEMATFDTDFGVTFGHFICFDLLFKSPAYDLVLSNVTHIMYPSRWYSKTPFLTSIQLQQGYAYSNNIVILSAGLNSPADGGSGSGIFVGKHGAIESIISYRNESKMLIAKVPKYVDDDEFIPDEPTIKQYSAKEMSGLVTEPFVPESVYPLKEYFHLADDSIDCEFTINFTKSNDDKNVKYKYKLAVFNGMRRYENIINAGEIYCAIVPCLSDDAATCGHIFKDNSNLVPSIDIFSAKIVMKIRKSNDNGSLIMPTSQDFSLHPLSVDKFQFSEVDGDENSRIFEIETTTKLSEILTFGFYGRNYTADNRIFHEPSTELPSTTTDTEDIEDEHEDNDNSLKSIKKVTKGNAENIGWKMTIYSCLMVVLCIVAAILVYRRLQHPYIHRLVVLRRRSEMVTA